MDRLGVQLDQTLLDRQGMIPSSKGLISTTELIFYLANRAIKYQCVADRKILHKSWWRAPSTQTKEGPIRA